MAPNFTGGVLKRHMPQENIHTKKCKPSSELVYSESSTMYHNLLASLGSANKVVADMNKRRQREEEGKSSDTEEDEDEDEDEESSGLSAEDDDDEIHQGADQHSLEGLTSNTEQKNNDNHHNEEKEEDSEDCETDDEEEEHELRSTNGQSSSTSAFSEHLCHKLSSEEVETLSKGNLKFKWEAPAMGMPNYTWKGTRPNFLHVAQSDATYGLKPKLYKHWLQLYEKSGGKDFESSNRRTFFSICNSYLDILHPNKRPFYSRGGGEDSSHMDAYLMHSLNHIFRTRDLVKKNESKIFKHSEEEILSDDGFLDQGFTRPKVLILLPYRSIAFRVVMRLIQLTPEAQRVNVQHLDRFNNEFGCDDGDVKTSKNEKSKKPSDWQALIGEGNDDDTFMLGIKHTRKSIRLYGDFYSSDIIIASPVGLLVAIGKAEENKELDVDYLSSIEVLVIDHADVMSMQNWATVATVVKQLNRLPVKQHGTNVMRIRPLYLDGRARFYRQSIILSSYLIPEMNSLFNHHCLNYKGKMKLECEYKGVLQEVLCSVMQIYERFDSDSMIQVDRARHEYFTKKVFPKIRDSVQGGVMIFINSFFELFTLKMFLMSQKASFCILDEYASKENKSYARQKFFEGSKKIMLYTERAYFYWRYKVRGVKNLIFYSLPERKEFYPQIMNMLEESQDMMSTVLFSRFDQLRLARIVGDASAKKMISSEKSIFTFR